MRVVPAIPSDQATCDTIEQFATTHAGFIPNERYDFWPNPL
jgi:hypothetical protein